MVFPFLPFVAKLGTWARVKAPWPCHPTGTSPPAQRKGDRRKQKGHPKAVQHKTTASRVLCSPAARKAERGQADVRANPVMKKLTIMCISAASQCTASLGNGCCKSKMLLEIKPHAFRVTSICLLWSSTSFNFCLWFWKIQSMKKWWLQ